MKEKKKKNDVYNKGKKQKKNYVFNGVKSYVEEKAFKAVGNIQDYLDNKLAKTTIAQDSRTVMDLTRLKGVTFMRASVIKGFVDTDFPEIVAKHPGITISEILKPYREEPKFQKVLDKLTITWEDMELLAVKGGAQCGTLEL